MQTAMPLRAWRMKFGEHFAKRPTWCQACEDLCTKAQNDPREGQRRMRADGVVVMLTRAEPGSWTTTTSGRVQREPPHFVVKDAHEVFTRWPTSMVATWPIVRDGST